MLHDDIGGCQMKVPLAERTSFSEDPDLMDSTNRCTKASRPGLRAAAPRR
jgi:hypothetical protein